MKYIKTYEQYIVPAHNPEPILQWDILEFLNRRSEACSTDEILGNFPDEEKTKEALKFLSDRFYIDETEGNYIATKDGSEHLKTIVEVK